MQIVATVKGKKRKRFLHVERLRFSGLPAGVWLYKKMKRLGIE
jgi:hypothetical protein